MYFESDGRVLLYYECDGDPRNPGLLLWNGARCTLRQWDHVIPTINRFFYIIRCDVRGSGQSKAPTNCDYTMQAYAKDAINLLNHLGVSQCHVWSMAWGSRAAMAFCAFHFDRVISASLFDLSIGKADVRAQREGTKIARRKQADKGYNAPPLPEGWNSHLDENTLELSLAASRRLDLSALAPKLTMPVLVATGDHDPNLKSSKEAVRIMPNGKLVQLPNVGHGSILMQPDLCIEVFLDFMDQEHFDY